MIILDTNVVSELMGPQCDPAIRSFVDSKDPTDIYSTAITAYEISLGIARLPEGKRKDRLAASWHALHDLMLLGRVLPLDRAAGAKAGELKQVALAAGNNCDICDILIAGIAATHAMTIASRNAMHFRGLPVQLVDPWRAT